MSIESPQNPSEESAWRQRLRRWMKPPRRLSFTSAGKYFVLLTIGIGFGAINTGNNLLFLLLGMMLSLIIASGILSEAVIRRLDARRNLPKRLFAGSNAAGAFSVENPSRWPSLSIEVSERNATGERGPMAGTEIGPKRRPWWKFWKSGKKVDGANDKPVAEAYTLRIEGGERLDLPTRYRLPRRGLYELAGLNVVTRFPFGLFEKRRELDDRDQMVVYPAPLDVDDWIATVHARFGDVAQNKRGMGEEYFGLRDYRPGEDQRMIHWKSSARRGEVVVRETERQEQRAVEVCLLNCTGQPASQRHLHEPAFEKGLRRTVGLIQALQQRGYRVGLRTLDAHVPASDESNHLDRMLATLAVTELRDGSQLIALPDARRDGGVGRILVGLQSATAAGAAAFDLVLPFEDAESTPRPRQTSEEAA